ncbi:MAG: acetylpolyamine amidohydrolase [Dehalococcoidia bacterium]|nr:acetylpolyamine amidohydrolase [Dehalococcoidia bacterium]
MFRIRRVYDDLTPTNKEAVKQVQKILRTQFYLLSRKEIAKLPEQLRNPFKYRFRSLLFVAEGSKGKVRGFALLLHEPVLNFCYLDYISTAKRRMGRGIGGALYERVREEALYLQTIGIFFESLPDTPELSRDPNIRKQNAARLRFYERYGARPISNTAYETPLKQGTDNPPYLVYDDLGQGIELRRDTARAVVRAILESKYGDVVPPGYIEKVVESFKDDPIKLREPRYIKQEATIGVKRSTPADRRIALLVNDQHAIHHVRERGYVESPVRIDVILKELDSTDIFQKFKPCHFSERHIKAVHDTKFVDYLRKVCASLEARVSVYPYVFPVRNVTRPPKDLPVRAGYYCIDTFTPLNRNAYLAAKRAVDCALTAAEKILEDYRLAYVLVRPPGHHSERRSFGGFCYFNSTAIAANYLVRHGRTAILDIDYHHGNGQQNIFFERSDVMTVSIHGHPSFAYPYFSGFRDEKGIGAGKGYNVNYPLPENVDGKRYRQTLTEALGRVTRFRPRFLVVALGLDTAKGDPTGSWSLSAKDFEANGRMIGSLHLPTLVVQEGGYGSRVLGINARNFLVGLWSGAYSA